MPVADDEIPIEELWAGPDEDPAKAAFDVGNVVQFRAGVRPRPANGRDLPVITLQAGELHNIATQAEEALVESGTQFYVRGGRLMRPVVDDMPASHGRRAKVARLEEVTAPVMVDHLSRSALWIKYDGRSKKMVPADPRPEVAATILSRDGEWRFPRLAGVITTPTLRPDGTVLMKPGYDPATQLLLLDPPEMHPITPRPSKKQAQSALTFLDSLLDEFPFVDDASRSVALSALITPVVRGAMSVVPMHVTKAPVAGSGKSYIIELASAINSGERAPVLSAGKSEEEMEKRLVGALLSGQTLISLDNVNGELGGDFLCQVIERPVVAARPLGQSAFVKIESRASCFATGNNIRLVGDMTRRVIVCSLDPDMERPELRTFRGDPFDAVLKERGKYVSAALTIVRAYVVAGFPNTLPPLASFEEWSRFVRSALVWLGRKDPIDTMEKARGEDPVRTALTNLYNAWYDAVQGTPKTTSEIAASATSRIFDNLANPALHDALIDIADDRRGGISTKTLGRYLATHKDRVVDGFKMIESGKDRTKKALWKVVKI
jgi:putative DNA primase/helicase